MPKPRQDLQPNRRFPHCPNEKCRFHLPNADWRYHRFGRHTRKSDGRTFVRYRCRTCRRTFCIRTFSSDYWLRYRELLPLGDRQTVHALKYAF